MPPLGISEFTYGFAFLREQVERFGGQLRAVPILPSLKVEKAKGWDAHLPLRATDMYFQFKMSRYLTQSNAKYFQDGTYSSPYWEFELHRRDNNHQHRVLKRLARVSPETFYAAPEVVSASEFELAFLAGKVAEKSKLIPLASCGDHDDGHRHTFTFQSGDGSWIEHSESIRRVGARSGAEIAEIYRSSATRWRALDRDFASDLLEKVRACLVDEPAIVEHWTNRSVEEAFLEGAAQSTTEELLVRSSTLVHGLLGATLVLVGEGSQPHR